MPNGGQGGGPQKFGIAQFVFDFDRPVALQKGANAAPRAVDSLTGLAPNADPNNAMPDITSYGVGLAALTCTVGSVAGISTWQSYQTMGGGGGDGPPSFLLIAPSTMEPVVALLNIIGGSSVANASTFLPNRLALAVLNLSPMISPPGLTFDQFSAAVLACAPRISFPGNAAVVPNAQSADPSRLVAVAGGGVYTGSVSFAAAQVVTNQCSPSAVTAFRNAFEGITRSLEATLAAGAMTQQSTQQFSMAFASLTARAGYQGCKALLESFVSISLQPRTVAGSTSCNQQWGTLAFLADPCCNSNMQQCCVAAPTTVSVPIMTGTQDAVIAQKCRQPTAVKTVLSDYLSYQYQQQQAQASSSASTSSGASDAWQKYTAFMQTCQLAIYNQKCTTDAECLSDSCDRRNGWCLVPWGSEAPLLAKCYAQNMRTDLAFEWKRMWGMPAVYASPAAEIADWQAQMAARLSSQDCAGPESDAFRSKSSSVKDATTGQWTQMRVPANATGCTSVKRCNWNYQATNEASCNALQAADAARSQFCGACNGGGSCQDLTQYASCTTWASSAQDCAERGGSWTTTQWGQTQCSFPALTTVDACWSDVALCTSAKAALNALPAGKMFNYGDFACSGGRGPSLCYSVSLTTRALCVSPSPNPNNVWLQWDEKENVCMTWAQTAAQCTAYGADFRFWSARQFTSGKYDTQTLCSAGQCSIWELGQAGASASVCSSTSFCSQPCKACVSQNDVAINPFNRDSTRLSQMCTVTGAMPTTQADCAARNGATWTPVSNQNGQQTSLCLLAAGASSAAACAAAGGLWQDCRSVSPSECGTGAYQAQLQCSYNVNLDCASAGDCAAAGQCDDWEFQTCTGATGCQSGACLKPYTLSDENGYPRCADESYYASIKQPPPTGANGQPQLERWARNGCIAAYLTTPQTCATAGFSWKRRAATQAQCAAQGTGCKEANALQWGLSTKSAAACTACGGTPTPLYTWTPGQLLTGQMHALTWQARGWVSSNRMVATMDWFALSQVVGNVISALQMTDTVNQMKAKYAPLVQLVGVLACDCSSAALAGQCFAAAVAAPLAKCRLDPGVASKCSGVRVASTALAGQTASQIATVSVLGAGQLAASFDRSGGSASLQNANKQKSSLGRAVGAGLATVSAAAAQWAVVKASASANSAVVGQLIGDGKSVTFSGSAVSSFEICLDRNLAIATDAVSFPDTDVAAVTKTSTNLAGAPQPLFATVTTNGLQVCTTITGAGAGSASTTVTYFPVIRMTPAKIAAATGTGSGGPPATSAAQPAAVWSVWMLLSLLSLVAGAVAI